MWGLVIKLVILYGFFSFFLHLSAVNWFEVFILAALERVRMNKSHTKYGVLI